MLWASGSIWCEPGLPGAVVRKFLYRISFPDRGHQCPFLKKEAEREEWKGLLR